MKPYAMAPGLGWDQMTLALKSPSSMTRLLLRDGPQAHNPARTTRRGLLPLACVVQMGLGLLGGGWRGVAPAPNVSSPRPVQLFDPITHPAPQLHRPEADSTREFQDALWLAAIVTLANRPRSRSSSASSPPPSAFSLGPIDRSPARVSFPCCRAVPSRPSFIALFACPRACASYRSFILCWTSLTTTPRHRDTATPRHLASCYPIPGSTCTRCGSSPVGARLRNWPLP